MHICFVGVTNGEPVREFLTAIHIIASSIKSGTTSQPDEFAVLGRIILWKTSDAQRGQAHGFNQSWGCSKFLRLGRKQVESLRKLSLASQEQGPVVAGNVEQVVVSRRTVFRPRLKVLQSTVVVSSLVFTERQERVARPGMRVELHKLGKGRLRLREAVLFVQQAGQPPPALVPGRMPAHALRIESNGFVETTGVPCVVGFCNHLTERYLRILRLRLE